MKKVHSKIFQQFDTMPIGVLVLNPELTVMFWNKLLTEWTGIKDDQAIGKSIADLYPNIGTLRYSGRILPVFEGGPPVIFSPQLHPHLIPSVRADGRKRIQQITVTRLEVDDVFYALFSIQDVTELVLTAEESRRLHKKAIIEIEQRKNIEASLHESSQKLRSIFHTAVEAIIVINSDYNIEEFNPAAERIFGYRADEIIGRNVNMLMPEPYQSEHDSYVERYIKTGRAKIIGIGRDVAGLRKDGTVFPIRLSVSETRVGNKLLFTGIISDITEQKQLEDQLRNLAMKDGLTGIGNRRSFDEALTAEWKRMQRQKGQLSILMMDIDFFKRYNDTYGHQEGDACLKKVAAAIAETVHRPGDLAARYGGEEFVVLLPMTTLDAATELAERIRHAVENLKIPHAASDTAHYVTISVGVANTSPDQTARPEMLLKLADQGLYEAKTSGRNRIKTAKRDYTP